MIYPPSGTWLVATVPEYKKFNAPLDAGHASQLKSVARITPSSSLNPDLQRPVDQQLVRQSSK